MKHIIRNHPNRRKLFLRNSIARRRFKKSIFTVLTACVTVIALFSSGNVASANPNVEQDAWVWGDNPTVDRYKPTPRYVNNPSGGSTEIIRNGRGLYTVRFAGHSLNGGNAQVTAYGSTASCGITRWYGNVLGVSCVDADDRPTDAHFTAYHTDDTQDAWVWGNNPTAENYTPSSAYVNNPSGGSTEIIRNGRGLYTVRFAGHSLNGGNAQVTAYGSTASCGITRWHGNVLGVSCMDSNGKRVDSRFTAHHTKDTQDAWVWGNNPTAENYTPSSAYVNNPSGGSTEITRIGTGFYAVDFDGYTMQGGNVQVSSYGSNTSCAATPWEEGIFGVHCVNSDGKPADTRFSALYVDSAQPGGNENASSDGYVWINRECDWWNYEDRVVCESYEDQRGNLIYETKVTDSFRISFTDDVDPETVRDHLSWETPAGRGGEPLFDVSADPNHENVVIVTLLDWSESCGSTSPGYFSCGVFTLDANFTALNGERLGQSAATAPESLQIANQGLD